MKRAEAAILGFAEAVRPARELAEALQLARSAIDVHRFPDGESLVRIDMAADTAIIYRSLDHPNDKLVELMLAAAACRDAGAERLVLVAPYLCYMRQDTAFREGEAVSQRVVAQLLDDVFDAVLTVDPHLHRIGDLGEIFPSARTFALSAAPLLAEHLRAGGYPADTVLLGPDGESRQWVEAVAAPLGLETVVGRKIRHGDRDVRIEIPDAAALAGRAVVMVDDVVSTGTTLAVCARQLAAAGVRRIDALAVHMLAGPEDVARLRDAGIAGVASTDSVPHESNAVHLAPLLAATLRTLIR
jgi:ribose-phosphate pyrophosphokinase